MTIIIIPILITNTDNNTDNNTVNISAKEYERLKQLYLNKIK